MLKDGAIGFEICLRVEKLQAGKQLPVCEK